MKPEGVPVAPKAHPYVEICRRHYAAPIVFSLLLVAFGVFSGRRVGLDPSTSSLLPADTPTLAALDELERRVPSASRATFLVASSDPAFNVAATARIRDEVARWDETRWALDRRDPQALMERRLQLVPADELAALADDVEAIIDWEECERLPGCINLESKPEIPTREELDARFMAIPEIASLVRYLGRTSVFEEPEGARHEAVPDGALCARDGTVCAVEAAFEGSPSNLAYATTILERGEALLAALRRGLSPTPPDLRMAFAGPFRDAPMTKQVMERDLQKTSWIGGALVIAWLLVQFRGLRPLVLLLLPLATGVLTTLGVVGVLGLELNLVSAFTFAILVGIGVDFGVHLLMHYGDLRREGVPLVDALGQAMLELRGSMAAAAFTTAFAFGMLTFAEFRGLSQLGGIAAVGVLVAVLVYRLLVPPLAIAMDALVAEKRSPVREHAWLRARPPTRRRSVATAIGFFALAVVLSYFAKDASFEYDFRRLNPKEIAHGIESSATMHGASGVPIYVLAHDVTEAASVAREIESDLAQGFTTKERLLSLSLTNFLPPDVDARLVEIRRMRAALDRIWPKLDEEDRARLEEVRELVRRDDPITIELLPEFVRDSFVERDGTPGAFAVVYVRVSGSDAVLMEKLSRIIQRFREAHPGVQIAAPAAVVGEIMPSLRADGPLVVGVTLLGLFVTTLVISRSLRRTILVIAPVLVGSGVAIGLLGLFDVRINFYNMLIIPVAYGIGIDGAIYVAWAMEGPPETREAALRVARRGVIASSMTTLGAFASFVFASNPGLTSLGNAAIIMLGSMLVATTYWLPAVYRAREAAPGGAEPIETSAGTPPLG